VAVELELALAGPDAKGVEVAVASLGRVEGVEEQIR
jgi:hypothetical protein